MKHVETRTGNEYWQFNPDARNGAGEFRYNWELILPTAKRIMLEYRTTGVTLRQLFYRLVAMEALPNTDRAYGSLSDKTAKARRDGWFPSFIDNNRTIDRPHLWTSAANASAWLLRRYMEDRSATQDVNLYIGVEKKGLAAQLFQWFAPLGLPVVALGGYASQTIADEVAADTERGPRAGKDNILIYAGDFDADGEDIPRDFAERAGCFDDVIRVALNPEQVESMNLPPQPGKHTSSRARRFALKYYDLFQHTYGLDLVQIELDAIPPTQLRMIYEDAVDRFYDYDAYNAVIEHEDEQKAILQEVVDNGDGDFDYDEDDDE